MRRTKESKTGEEGGPLTAFDWAVSNSNSQHKLEATRQEGIDIRYGCISDIILPQCSA